METPSKATLVGLTLYLVFFGLPLSFLLGIAAYHCLYALWASLLLEIPLTDCTHYLLVWVLGLLGSIMILAMWGVCTAGVLAPLFNELD